MTPASESQPLKVLFVSGTPLGTATCRYRCEHLAEVLRSSGAEVDVVYIGQPRVRVAHDIVVLYRVCATTEGRRFARAARDCGAALVYSTDDVVFDADAAPPQMGKRFRALAPPHRQMLNEADAALASTEYLARWMQTAAPETPVYTVRNFLSADIVRLSEDARKSADRAPAANRITLGYLSGSPTHDEDLAAVASPLARVLEANPLADLMTVGPVQLPASLGKFETTGQVRRLASVPWQELPRLIAEQGVSINLAPLDLSRPFCHAKSEVKYLEAAALGIPTVASAGEGFSEAIPNPEGEEGCFLAATPGDWERHLNCLLQQAVERAQSGSRAYRQLYSVAATDHAESVSEVFQSLMCLRRLSAVSGRVETVVNWPFSARYALKSALERGARLRLQSGKP